MLAIQSNLYLCRRLTKNRGAFPFVIYGLSLGELFPLAKVGSSGGDSAEKAQRAQLHLEISVRG